MVVKTIAKRHGLYATFMPKPITDVDGSGMHINMSLEKDGKNIFFDKSNPMGLSKECYHFISGLIKHAKGMSCICNPLVNSYKRLVPGYEAPVAICWSSINRSPLIRIPASRGAGTRIEFRSPDPAANPYLVMALCLAAGLDGIENELEAPEPIRNLSAIFMPFFSLCFQIFFTDMLSQNFLNIFILFKGITGFSKCYRSTGDSGSGKTGSGCCCLRHPLCRYDI